MDVCLTRAEATASGLRDLIFRSNFRLAGIKTDEVAQLHHTFKVIQEVTATLRDEEVMNKEACS